MAALSKNVIQRIVSLKERGFSNREVLATLKREGAVVHVTMQIVRGCLKRYAASRGDEDQEGRLCALLPVFRQLKT